MLMPDFKVSCAESESEKADMAIIIIVFSFILSIINNYSFQSAKVILFLS